MKRFKKLNSMGFDHVFLAFGFVIIFAIIGTAYIVLSHAAAGTNYLAEGETLWYGQTLNSGNGYTLSMQTDGNLVVYNPSGGATWASNTNGTGATNHVTMQADGNLVLYNPAGTALWSSGTYGYGPSALYMQTDGNLVIYKDSGTSNGGGPAVWATQSGGLLQYTSPWSTLPVLTTNGGTCMSVKGNSTAEGALIQEWGCTGSSGQQFEFRTIRSAGLVGYYEIVSNLSGQCLDISGGNTANGLQVQQWGCNGNNNQLFSMRAGASGGYYNLVNRATNKCIDLTAGNPANGTAVQQWDCINNANQSWSGNSVSSAYAYSTAAQGPGVTNTPPPSGGGGSTGGGCGTSCPPPGPTILPFPSLTGNAAPGQMIGCTQAVKTGCQGQWFYRTGSVSSAWGGVPAGYGAIWGISDLSTNAPIGVYIGDQTDVSCPSSSGVNCQKQILSYYTSHGAKLIYVAYTDPKGCGANPSANPFANLGGKELYEWYYSTTNWYCGTNTAVKSGAPGYLINRFFLGTNPNKAPVVGSTSIPQWSQLWNNAVNDLGGNGPIMWW